jgi:hypothetical protein
MRLRDKINLLIDLLLALALAFIAGIGFLIKYILPPGREKILKYGDNKDFFFLGLDRHQWGEIHLFVAYVMLALLLLHILFHGKTLLCQVRKAITVTWLRRSLWVIVGVLCLVLFLFAFFISPEQRQTGDFLHRNTHSSLTKTRTYSTPSALEPEKDIRTAESMTNHDHGQRHMEESHSSLNGRMPLADTAKQFGIPMDEVKKRLGLPADVDALETLGRLRKTHGFTMQEVRESLEKNDGNH